MPRERSLASLMLVFALIAVSPASPIPGITATVAAIVSVLSAPMPRPRIGDAGRRRSPWPPSANGIQSTEPAGAARGGGEEHETVADRAHLGAGRRATLAEEVADAVAEAIATRRLAPGERLVETALAERLGVSRIPVREGLRVLQAQGILTVERNRGYRVAAFGPEAERRVYEVRLSLETILLRDALAAWRAGRGSPAVLDGPLEAMANAARADDVAASLRADLDFHRGVRRAAGNEVAGILWDAIARHVLIVFSGETYRADDLALVAAQHRDLRDWIVARVGDPLTEDALRARVEDHLFQVIRSRRPLDAGPGPSPSPAPAAAPAAAPAPMEPT